MLSFNNNSPLLGCGIDAEQVSRFRKLEKRKSSPSPFIFSDKEVEHCFKSAEPSISFCAAFCCKEAVLKVLQKPYNYTDCEFLYHSCRDSSHCSFTKEFEKCNVVTDNRVYVELTQSGECVVSVYLFGGL